MTYPAYCGDAARVPTHCGTFIDPDPDPEVPAPEPAAAPALVAELPPPGPSFGGPLFDGLLGNELVGF